MTSDSGTTRWWENYLVRYFMPSIAGVIIVSWLCSHADPSLRPLLYLPAQEKLLDAPALTLLFLYANLFCYVASYPILLFHATRVIDFRAGKWRAHILLDGYLATFIVALVAFCVAYFASAQCRYYLVFLIVVAFAIMQLCRVRVALAPRIHVEGLTGEVSPAYGLVYSLARRRGVAEETKRSAVQMTEPILLASSNDDDERVSTSRRLRWHAEVVETYRHLREHGNSAFIFVLELVLAALVYCVLSRSGQSPSRQLSAIGLLFAIWALPAVFVHFLGQHLERRFSKFDARATPQPQVQDKQS